MTFLEYALILLPMFFCTFSVIAAIRHVDNRITAELDLLVSYMDRIGDMGSDHIKEQRESFQAIHSKLNKG